LTADSANTELASGRERLLDAAAQAFSERGYAASSIAAIARKAGMSKSTVFHHFDSKEALYVAVIAAAVESFGERLHSLLNEAGGCVEVVLREFQREHLRHMHGHQQVTQLVLRELQYPALDHKRPVILDLLSRNLEQLTAYLRSARDSGEIRSDTNCRLMAMMMFSANAFFFQHARDISARPDLLAETGSDELATGFINLVYKGLAPGAVNGVQQ